MKLPKPFSFVAVSLMAAAAHADTYVYEIESISAPFDLGTFGGDESVANDVNDAGHVVGWAEMIFNIPHAFLYRYGTKHDIAGEFGLLPSYANGINNNGDVVGYYTVPGASWDLYWDIDRPFYWHDSLMTLDAAGVEPPRDTVPLAINDHGRIVGYTAVDDACGGSDIYDAAQWETPYSSMQVIQCPGNSETAKATDVNNAGVIAGLISTGPGQSWIWNGAPTWVPAPAGAGPTEVWGINESGVVVGDALMSSSYFAFLWNGTAATSKWLGNLPGGDRSVAYEVNDQSFVAGRSRAAILLSGGFSYTMRDRGFIWHANFGMKALPILPGTTAATANCQASSLSNRNQFTQNFYVVGYCTNAAGKRRAVRWTVKVIKKSVGNIPPVEP